MANGCAGPERCNLKQGGLVAGKNIRQLNLDHYPE
jgi:hypothetical protein